MTVEEVRSKRSVQEFLALPKFIYKDDPVWVCPLDQMIEDVFDPGKNNFHEHGEITRWIIRGENGTVTGRIAAFINTEKAFTYPQPTGGVGFFECIDDQEAANLLFSTAQTWLAGKGMKAMDGPINFGENDTFWGLLTEGFTHPSFGMNYHRPYYKKMFETYGFRTIYEQITNHLDVNKPFPERFTKIAHWVMQKEGYSFAHFDKKHIEKFAADFIEIYNDAWQDHPNFVPISLDTVYESFTRMKTIMDPKLIWFSYVGGDPASFILILPDANQMIKPLKGRLNLYGKMLFAFRRWKGVSRMRAVVMGTKQKYQKHGLESAMFIKLKEYVLPLRQYDELELSWVGDFNSKMLAIHEATGAHFGKKHVTMRYVFEA
ncbi:MAG: GNAT family N-acetyltransferase [Mucilaginibacter polytrichastri]|nr:GNAT family N-acetyltransferase [Mucilaginibacter polytrichastri]